MGQRLPSPEPRPVEVNGQWNVSRGGTGVARSLARKDYRQVGQLPCPGWGCDCDELSPRVLVTFSIL